MGQARGSKQEIKIYKIAREYIEIISNTLMPRTAETYWMGIEQFVRFMSTSYPEITCLKDIKRSPHIEAWLTHLTKKGLAKATRLMRICAVRRFFADINEWGWKDVPEPGLITTRDIPQRDKLLPKPLTPDEDRKLQEVLRNDHRFYPQAIFLLRKTGMRVGELQNLKVDSLEKHPSGEYVLHVPLGKMHTERIIPVDSETAEIFNRILEMRGRYLPLPDERTGEPVQFLLINKNQWSRPTYMGLLATIYSAARRAGIKRVTLHQLRHTYATELLRAGASLPVLMRLLGHKDISMTLVYAGVFDEDLNQAYHRAIQKINSLSLLPEPQSEVQKDDPDFILDTIDSIITKLNSVRQDTPENKKKLQRIAERLRRAYQDIADTIKSE